MAETLLPVLLKFHREVVLPDTQRVVGDLETRLESKFDEVNGHFDAISQRFDRLEAQLEK